MDQDAGLVSEFEYLAGIAREFAQLGGDDGVLRRLYNLRRRHESENRIDDRAERGDCRAAEQVVQEAAARWRRRFGQISLCAIVFPDHLSEPRMKLKHPQLHLPIISPTKYRLWTWVRRFSFSAQVNGVRKRIYYLCADDLILNWKCGRADKFLAHAAISDSVTVPNGFV